MGGVVGRRGRALYPSTIHGGVNFLQTYNGFCLFFLVSERRIRFFFYGQFLLAAEGLESDFLSIETDFENSQFF